MSDTKKEKNQITYKTWSWKWWWYEWIQPLLWAFVLALVIRAFIVQAFKIPTGSMRMTLIEGDRILVNKFGYCGRFELRIPFIEKNILSFPMITFREPKRGDIIVFRYPVDGKRDFVKRLVGLGGEVISIKDGRILVDGKIVTDPEIFEKFYYYNRPEWAYGKPDQEIHVPEGQYFVLGDNSAESSDSRNWGFVPRANLIGKAMCIYYPFKRLGGAK